MTREELAALAAPASWSERAVARLSAHSEAELVNEIGLTLGSYGTLRMLHRDPKEERREFGPWPAVPGMEFGIESLPVPLNHFGGDCGTELAELGGLDPVYLFSVLRASCNLISEFAPALSNSVQSLLRSIHIIDCSDPEIDLSFSLPELPHSVFLSVPPEGESDAAARLAEAIVHEVLHLQLTLVEGIAPIICPGAEPDYAFAPWRGELRSLGGVIHGLFVFRGVEILWSGAPENYSCGVYSFARQRIDEIRLQRKQVAAEYYASLMPFGREILSQLVNS